MTALLTSALLALSASQAPQTCLPPSQQTSATPTCCTLSTGRQCCSAIVNGAGKPIGCGC